MQGPFDNPLNDEHYNAIQVVLGQTARTRELLNRCQNCNFDVAQAIEENERQAKLASDLKAQFFPDRP